MTEEKNKIENIIPLSFDYKFKKVFGDNDAIDRLEVIISIIFNIPIQDIKGKITILNSEKLIESKNEKKGAMDVYLKLRLESGYERVDIEVSDKKLSQSIIDRNIMYGAHKLVTQLQRKEDYSTLEPIIIVSFSKGRIIYDEENNSYYTDDKVIRRYLLRDDEDYKILTKTLQFFDINIAKCYDIWYSKTVSEYEENKQNLIKLGALLCTRNKTEFNKCLEEIPMNEDVKNDIEKTSSMLNEEMEMFNAWYDYDRDQRAIKNGEISDAVKMALNVANKEHEKEKQELGEKYEKEKLELAKKLMTKGISKEEVAELTGLTLEQIENL